MGLFPLTPTGSLVLPVSLCYRKLSFLLAHGVVRVVSLILWDLYCIIYECEMKWDCTELNKTML